MANQPLGHRKTTRGAPAVLELGGKRRKEEEGGWFFSLSPIPGSGKGQEQPWGCWEGKGDSSGLCCHSVTRWGGGRALASSTRWFLEEQEELWDGEIRLSSGENTGIHREGQHNSTPEHPTVPQTGSGDTCGVPCPLSCSNSPGHKPGMSITSLCPIFPVVLSAGRGADGSPQSIRTQAQDEGRGCPGHPGGCSTHRKVPSSVAPVGTKA